MRTQAVIYEIDVVLVVADCLHSSSVCRGPIQLEICPFNIVKQVASKDVVVLIVVNEEYFQGRIVLFHLQYSEGSVTISNQYLLSVFMMSTNPSKETGLVM